MKPSPVSHYYSKSYIQFGDEVQEGETFTHIQLYIKGLAPKGEEVKAKNRKTPDARTREERWSNALKGGENLGGR